MGIVSDFVILSIGYAVSVVLSAVCMVYANHVLTEEPLTVGGAIKTAVLALIPFINTMIALFFLLLLASCRVADLMDGSEGFFDKVLYDPRKGKEEKSSCQFDVTW